MANIKEARAVKAQLHAQLVTSDPNFHGIGLSGNKNDGYKVKVNFYRESDNKLPKEIDGVVIEIEIVGEIKKRGSY